MAAESNLGAGLGGRRGVSTAGAAGDRRALRCGLLRLYVPRSRGVSTTGAARRSPAANATRVALRAGPALTMQAGVSGALFLCREMRLVTVDHNQGKAPTRCPNKRRSFMEFTSASLVSVFPGVGSAGQRASILLASSWYRRAPFVDSLAPSCLQYLYVYISISISACIYYIHISIYIYIYIYI